MTIGAVFLINGCAAGGSGNLGLAGYQSLEIAEVNVTGTVPYASDKLITDIRNGLKEAIDENRHWSWAGKPMAKLTVRITGGSEPTDSEQLIVGTPYSLSYTLMAQDADSGADLGTLSATSRARVRGSILLEGSDAAFADRNFEHHWREGIRHKGVIGQTVVDMERQLTAARRRVPQRIGGSAT
jgi:hypothetical protein